LSASRARTSQYESDDLPLSTLAQSSFGVTEFAERCEETADTVTVPPAAQFQPGIDLKRVHDRQHRAEPLSCKAPVYAGS
jgi:hypothetical protein